MIIKAYTDQSLTPVLDYLLPYEKFCVTLVSKIKEGSVPVYIVLDDSSIITGVLSYSQGGTVHHCLPLKDDAYKEQLYYALRDFFSNTGVRNLFSIIGESSGTELIQTVIKESFMYSPPYVIRYKLMEYHPSVFNKQMHDMTDKKCIRCTEQMESELYPMQLDYEQVEVSYNSTNTNHILCRRSLMSAIREKRVYACIDGTHIVAKATVSCKGIKSAYIGGVYTRREERSKGYATFLIQHVADDLVRSSICPALFVKESNAPAIKVYSKCGFEVVGGYKICYYK